MSRNLLWSIPIVFAAIMAVSLVWAPAAAAFLCPTCFGLGRVAPGLYLDRDATADEVRRFAAELSEAERRLDAFFPGASVHPVLLVCTTDACDRRLGGRGAKAMTYGATFIHVSPEGRNADILGHELSHIELHRRLGLWTLLRGNLPAWFDEGLAVIVSRDARYLAFGPGGEARCRVFDDGNLPAAARDWRRQAGNGARPLYAMAACRMLGWLDRHGGVEGVEIAIEILRAGGPIPE